MNQIKSIVSFIDERVDLLYPTDLAVDSQGWNKKTLLCRH